jgi:hypothetical protein
MCGKGGVQLGSERAYVRQRVTRSSSVVRCRYTEEAKQLLEAVTAEKRSDERMAEGLTPVHLRARQAVDAHEQMRAQEGVQLFSSGGSPAMRCCSIGVLRELLHQTAGQKAPQQLEWGAVGRQAVLLVA